MQIQGSGGDFCIDASLLGELLNVAPHDVQTMMRSNVITSTCERGEGVHLGRYRLTFFYRGRRLRLEVDEAGRLLRGPSIRPGEKSLTKERRALLRAIGAAAGNPERT